MTSGDWDEGRKDAREPGPMSGGQGGGGEGQPIDKMWKL